YVDDFLVTGTDAGRVYAFFRAMWDLALKDLGPVSKVLGICVEYDASSDYMFDQEANISEMLVKFGLEHAHGVRAPIGGVMGLH
ncbi:hypothetical protein PHYSODRAFT_517696, partial [Phytophthora sojae]